MRSASDLSLLMTSESLVQELQTSPQVSSYKTFCFSGIVAK